MPKKLILLALALIVSISFGIGAAFADDDEIPGQLQTALKLYKDGKLSQAISELEFALAQMRQKKGEAFTKLFPKAPDGWKAEKAKAESAGSAMMGGGITASQEYRRTSGPGRVHMEVMSDSPLLQSLGMILSNPMLMQGGSQGKLIRFKGNKGLLKDQGKHAELQAVINNKVLFVVKASRVDDAAKVAKTFANEMDFDKLSEMTK